MNKTLKWVLIGLGIAVVVFFIALSIFVIFGRVAGGVDGSNWGRMPFRSGYHMPFRGVMPMMGFFGLSRLLLLLVVIGFAVYGLVRLVGGNGAHHGAAPMQQTPPPVTGITERACVACGRTLPGEGEFCPHCGAKQ
jgi:hypothetical protein